MSKIDLKQIISIVSINIKAPEKDINIDSKSSGERAGLLIGDIIISVNYQDIKTKEDIIRVIDEGLFKTGDFVTLGILRNNSNLDILLELQAYN